jgi:hypothetical protein
MPDVIVTSIAREAGWDDAQTPSTESVRVAGQQFADAFREALERAAGPSSGTKVEDRRAPVGV